MGGMVGEEGVLKNIEISELDSSESKEICQAFKPSVIKRQSLLCFKLVYFE